MAMIVQQDVFETDASQSPAYSVGYTVTYEPKNPHLPYQANISVNGKVTAMMFFTERPEALRYAINAQMSLWLLRKQPKPLRVTVLAAQEAPRAKNTDVEEFSL